MAFPTVSDSDSQSGTQTSNSTSWTLTYPTNLASGDLILAFIAADGSGSANATASSFNHNVCVGTGDVACSVLAKISDGTETGTFTATISNSEQGAWQTMRIPASTWYGSGLFTNFSGGTGAGEIAGGSPAGVSAWADAGISANPNFNQDHNPGGWDIEDTLWISAVSVDTSRTISAYPSSPDVFDNTFTLSSGGAGGATLGLARLEKSAASVNAGPYTINTSDDWVVLSVAIRPAAADAFITTYAQAQAHILALNVEGFGQAQSRIKQTYRGYAQAQAYLYIPQYARPIADDSNDGWVRVVV